MLNSERGEKRLCLACGARFYDLGSETIHCPKCQSIFTPPPPPVPSAPRVRRQFTNAPSVQPTIANTESPESDTATAGSNDEIEDDVPLADDSEDDAAGGDSRDGPHTE